MGNLIQYQTFIIFILLKNNFWTSNNHLGNGLFWKTTWGDLQRDDAAGLLAEVYTE